jgi:hypothetical protein
VADETREGRHEQRPEAQITALGDGVDHGFARLVSKEE